VFALVRPGAALAAPPTGKYMKITPTTSVFVELRMPRCDFTGAV
jgi:hypothetical protein